LVPIGTFVPCGELFDQAQVIQAEEKPQVGLVACSFLASANTSGQVFGGAADTGLLQGIEVDPHHHAGRIERE